MSVVKMPQPPELDADKRRLGAQRSLELRRKRAGVKAGLAHGSLSIQEVFEYDELLPWAQGMKVRDLIMALPGYGKMRAETLLVMVGIPRDATVRACGPKQRERLFGQLSKQ